MFALLSFVVRHQLPVHFLHPRVPTAAALPCTDAPWSLLAHFHRQLQVVPAAKPFLAPGGAGLLPLLAKALPFDRLPSMFSVDVRCTHARQWNGMGSRSGEERDTYYRTGSVEMADSLSAISSLQHSFMHTAS